MDSNKSIEKKLNHSGVIVLYELSSDSLILTQRSEQLRSHPGEICFPGGRWEEIDENYAATALRELHEELGITPDRLNLIKKLKIEKTLLGVIIHPWIASIDTIIPYQLSEREVIRLISIPMHLVQDPTNYRDLIINKGGFQLTTCEFIANQDWVWGATARIMKQLVTIKMSELLNK